MIEYRLIRSDRRTLSISIDREGALVVHAPKRLSKKEIESFILQKQKWIAEKQAAVKQAVASRPQLTEGAVIPFWGNTLTIAFYGGKKADHKDGILWLPKDGETAAHARKWRLQQAQTLIMPRVEYWAQKTGFVPSQIAFGSAKTRWGSMNHHTRSLRLNAALVHCPPALADYVIVHELVHIIHPDHSAAFHAAVRSVLPDAEARRSQLKAFAYVLSL